MTENENIQTPTTTPPQPETNTIDLSKFSLGAENKSPQEPSPNLLNHQPTTLPQETPTNQLAPNGSQNLIDQLNNTTDTKGPDINLENIIINNSKPSTKESENLGTSGLEKRGEIQLSRNKIETIMIAYIATFISIISILITGLYSKYLSISTEKEQIEPSVLLKQTQNLTKTISEYTNINDYALRADKNDILIGDDAKNTAKTIIENKRLNYIQKKDVLEKNMATFVEDNWQNAQKLDKLKKEIVKYGFIPEQLYNIIEQQKGTNGIKKRMTLMENIKFLTAFKAFSYMESFVQGLANTLGKDGLLIESKLKETLADAEKDIIIYTNTCFLNPYEITSDCTTIGDFDNYYKIIDPQRKVDTTFIKQLANYVDLKLQESEIPTFSINFIHFNQSQESIDFTIDLNTYSQDEIALNKQGILNPHVFIVTNLINLLKQSLLVIGENIKTDQIKTTPKIIKVGSTVFTVNNSSIKLSLPIQKNSQREISDFFNSK